MRLGFDRKDDQPPGVWFDPIKRGDKEFHLMDYYKTHIITEDEMARILDDYYEERGWEKDSGAPTLAKLKELGLEDLVYPLS